MALEGHIKNGQIVLDHDALLPEGMRVRVELLEREVSQPTSELELPTLYERYRDIIGRAEDLPSDFAENHDHHIHGAPKKP
jgi:hypothetical protein